MGRIRHNNNNNNRQEIIRSSIFQGQEILDLECYIYIPDIPTYRAYLLKKKLILEKFL